MNYHSPGTMPLLEALFLLFPNSSKNNVRSWLKEGRISVSGTVVKKNNIFVQEGDAITLGGKQTFVESLFPILYSDSDLVFINKPTGLLSVSTAFETKETVFSHLKRKYHPKQVYVVHRLDQDTSGVMVFALSEKAFVKLKEKFSKHDIIRRYTAIVEGKLEKKGSWQSYLKEDSNYFVRSTRDASNGELAITHFDSKASSKTYSWLELTLETGKKNQIRVHCQDAGFPVVGDKKYGATSSPIKRLCLHAHHLELEHPITGKPLRVRAPIPTEFHRLIKPKEYIP